MKRSEKEISAFKKNLVELLVHEYPRFSEESIYQDMLLNIEQLRQEKLDGTELRLLNTAFKEL